MTDERRSGFGRRITPQFDGPCPLHEGHEKCFATIKSDIKDLERADEDTKSRLSALEPVTKHNQQEIDSMRKLQLGTLISALISAIGVISALALLLMRHVL